MALWSIQNILGMASGSAPSEPERISNTEKGKGRAQPYHVHQRPRYLVFPPPSSTVSALAGVSALADVTNSLPAPTRFASPIRKEEFDDICQPFVPDRTRSNNNWATRVFKAWVSNRNQICPDDVLPEDLLEVRYPLEVQDNALAAFILEARRADGKPYPGTTLRNIVAALFRVMKQHQGAANVVSFIDKGSREKYFPRYHNALDRMLWETGVLGFHSPQSLLNAVFYYNGNIFCLRGVSEHVKLRFSQIQHYFSPERYVYSEFGSKNRCGGVRDLAEGKVVSILATNSPNCHVSILNAYFSKMPPVKEEDRFYLNPLPFTPLGSRPWFSDDPCPIRKIQSLLKAMCADAGVEGNFTNHSLRATGATVLFDAGVPEAVIQKRTGHKSLDSLRTSSRNEMWRTSSHQRHLKGNRTLL